ncbi:NO-inducible flavohemoprotein [Kozakia baliensis]|uniref:NO-inducible flavohemoprotein n=1 Tax=Kozakia baliensis TaxID=153496 RepID=UPI00345BE00D
MSHPLDAATIATIKATIPALEAHGVDITACMYRKLLSDPQIAAMFNETDQQNGRQPRALAMAVLAYAKNIDNLGALGGAVERIAQKHTGLNVRPEQYPIVGKALLAAISETLGDAATPVIMDAWAKAYGLLADILIGREKTIYQEHADAPGGWEGWRGFRIEKRIRESDLVTSIILVPTDGKPVMRHLPGQYLTLAIQTPQGSFRRNYSISCAPNDTHYRISVKREAQGKISDWLHDHAPEGTVILLGAPAGDFTLKSGETPLALVSAGVGITPMLSMLETEAEKGATRPISFVHATHSSETLAFAEEVHQQAQTARAHVTLFLTTGENLPSLQPFRHESGHMTAEWLAQNIPPNADFYICGPESFQSDIINGLLERSIPAARIHHEYFGPDEQMLAA